MRQLVTSKIFLWNQFPADLAKHVVHFELTQRINVWNDNYFKLCVHLYLIEGLFQVVVELFTLFLAFMLMLAKNPFNIISKPINVLGMPIQVRIGQKL